MWTVTVCPVELNQRKVCDWHSACQLQCQHHVAGDIEKGTDRAHIALGLVLHAGCKCFNKFKNSVRSNWWAHLANFDKIDTIQVPVKASGTITSTVTAERRIDADE